MATTRLQRRLRHTSRLALYGSLLLTVVFGGVLVYLASAPFRPTRQVDWRDVDFASLEEVQLLQQYVRIDTSERTGSSLDGARFLRERLAEAGIDAHLERVGDGDANLWAVLEGEQPGAIVLHHHIDVENVDDPESWLRPPFEGVIEPPWIHGRGTFDMKSIGIAQLLAFIDLAESRGTPRHSVILLATAGEEVGSELGTRWILREHPELVARFRAVLTEGGVVEGRTLEDLKYWGTEFAQKRFWTLTACASDRRRLEALRDDLLVYGAEEPRLFLPEAVRRFLPHYAHSRDREDLRQTLADPEAIVRDRPLFGTLPTYIQSMFRNELHPFEIRKTEGGWELPVKVHLLPGVDFEQEVEEHLIPEWLFWGVDTTLEREPPPRPVSPIDHPVMQTIQQLLDEAHPGVPAGPLFLPWTATDARFFRAAGVPTYGLSPFMIFTTDALRVGSPTERISLPGYVSGVEIYRRLVRRLAARDLPEADADLR